MLYFKTGHREIELHLEEDVSSFLLWLFILIYITVFLTEMSLIFFNIFKVFVYFLL